jgi:dihydroorotase
VDLVVEGRAWVRGRMVEAAIGVEGDRIARVAKSLPSSEVAGARRLRVHRGVILPGAIDAHVHLREPGLERKETIATGTLAALHGGVTTVLEMPNTVPPVVTKESFEAKRARFERDALVDWGLHAMVDPELRCFALGQSPVGYKCYLGGSTNATGVPPSLLPQVAQRARRAGRPLVVHAEHPDFLQEGAMEHGARRPAEAEWEGIRAVGEAADAARVLVAHVSTARGLSLARKAGLRSEVAPHHLLLDDRALATLGAKGFVNPPLRGPKERAALWKAFAQGKADTLASDHAPHTLEEKARGLDQAPSGLPGVETMLPLLLAKVRARALGLGTLVRAASEGPAQVFGLSKGAITEGLDADLVIADLARVEPIHAARLHSKCGWTPYEGHKAVFPSVVVLGGRVALEDGEALAGKGREVKPGLLPSGKPSRTPAA